MKYLSLLLLLGGTLLAVWEVTPADLAAQPPPRRPGQPPTTPKTEAASEKPATPEQVAFFEKSIRPVLVKECYSCHAATADKIKGGLTLDTRAGLRKGGEHGPALVPGEPSKSLLLKMIRHEEGQKKIPPKSKLADEVLADFEEWIAIAPQQADRLY